MHILLTGSTGFIGQVTLLTLRNQGHNLSPIKYRGEEGIDNGSTMFENIEVVIHLAAQTNLTTENLSTNTYYATNTTATLNLARQSVVAGVKRFIFLSTVKVNGENTHPEQPFTTRDIIALHQLKDPYAISKYEAEKGLMQIAQHSSMEVVIIRPPLVYGAGVKGNLLNMMNWLNKGFPLPFASIHNKRSLVALPNLVDLIKRCLTHPAAANRILFVSDGQDLSTVELLQGLGMALGKPPRLLPAPQFLLESGFKLLGKKHIAQRLCGNLQIDISETCNLLDWTPPMKVDEALQKTAQAYLQQYT